LSYGDVDHYVIIRKLLQSVFTSHLYSYASGKFKYIGLILISPLAEVMCGCWKRYTENILLIHHFHYTLLLPNYYGLLVFL
jgi:hypothetical protein